MNAVAGFDRLLYYWSKRHPTSASLFQRPYVFQAQGSSLEDNLDRTVFVGNLRATTKPKAVKQLFARCQSCLHVQYHYSMTPRSSSTPAKKKATSGKHLTGGSTHCPSGSGHAWQPTSIDRQA